MGGSKKVNILKWLKYPGDNDMIGKRHTMLANEYHLSIFSILRRSVNLYVGVSVTIISHPIFSHDITAPMANAIIPQ